jgi:phosphoglycolate phosphatase
MSLSKCVYDAVLIDLDGTLVDSAEDIAAAVSHALLTVGRTPTSMTLVRDSIGDGLQILIERCLGQPRLTDIDLFDHCMGAFRSHHDQHLADRTTVYPGIRTLISELDAPIAVVSNKPEAYCKKLLSHLKLLGGIQLVIGGDTFPTRKPDPAPLLHALSALQVEPDRAVMVGDGVQDMLAASAAGVDPVGVLWGQGQSSSLKEAGARVMARDVAALRVVLIEANPSSEF